MSRSRNLSQVINVVDGNCENEWRSETSAGPAAVLWRSIAVSREVLSRCELRRETSRPEMRDEIARDSARNRSRTASETERRVAMRDQYETLWLLGQSGKGWESGRNIPLPDQVKPRDARKNKNIKHSRQEEPWKRKYSLSHVTRTRLVYSKDLGSHNNIEFLRNLINLTYETSWNKINSISLIMIEENISKLAKLPDFLEEPARK